MDSITQGLLGGAVGQAIFGPRYGKRAGWLAALGAMAPDLDIVIRSASDPMMALRFHRHFTHSALFVPIGGLIVAAVLFPLWRRAFSWKVAWLVAAVGYATHAPLDICTSYGTQYLWPFSNARLSVDWVGIIDLFYSVPLLIGWIMAARRRTARPAWVALGLTTAYLLFGGWQHHRAMNAQEALAQSRGHTVERSRAMPMPLSVLLWRSIYEHEGHYYADAIRVPIIGEPQIYPGGSVAAVTAAELTESLPDGSVLANDIEIFEWFSDRWLYRDDRSDGAIGDFRYGLLPNATASMWGITVDTTAPDEHITRWNNRERTSGVLSEFWKMITGAWEPPADAP